MKEQRIPFQGASVGSRWAANTTLLFASVAVDELHPDRMRGGNFIVCSTGRLSELSTFLDFYSKQLQNWLRDSIGVLQKAFESAADMYRIQLLSDESPISQDPSQITVDL